MSTLSATDATELFRSAPDRMIDVEGGRVACRSIGTGPDVLFVHGWPVSGATFRLLLPHLVEHVTCHVVDLLGAGSSTWTDPAHLSVHGHVRAVRRVVDGLELERVAVVGHDSGGMIARHALAGDGRLSGMGLIDTEMPDGTGWRFRSFIAGRKMPGFGRALGWLAARPRLRRNGFVLGDAFVDRSLLDGAFDEFFLRPLATDPRRLAAAMQVFRSFDMDDVHALAELHQRIRVPVQLVWGEQDKFFPVERARAQVASFPDARISVVAGAGLFSHEERPAEVATALLPALLAARQDS